MKKNKEIAFKEIVVTREEVSVVLEYIGEGYCEEYNPKNPKDEPLVRFTILKDGEQMDDASYCTTLSIHTDRKKLEKVANTIMNEVWPEIVAENSIKKICEELSHIQA
jgi:hypothetical protein